MVIREKRGGGWIKLMKIWKVSRKREAGEKEGREGRGIRRRGYEGMRGRKKWKWKDLYQ